MLAIKMPNGVTVSDWLGTAGVSARHVSMLTEEMRDRSNPQHKPTLLNEAIKEAQQCLNELLCIRQQIELGGVETELLQRTTT